MTALYNSHAKKKATNLSINSDLLKKAKKIQNWKAQNKTFIKSYNERITKHGAFSNNLTLSF